MQPPLTSRLQSVEPCSGEVAAVVLGKPRLSKPFRTRKRLAGELAEVLEVTTARAADAGLAWDQLLDLATDKPREGSVF